MSDADLLQLYSARILGLAASIPHLGTLPAPEGSAKARAPLCGSSVSVQVALRDGRISEFAQDVRACALGQAAAAVVGASVIGRTPAEVAEGRASLRRMLEGGAVPVAPWEGFEALLPARDYSNRHGSILLAFDATLAALADAQA